MNNDSTYIEQNYTSNDSNFYAGEYSRVVLKDTLLKSPLSVDVGTEDLMFQPTVKNFQVEYWQSIILFLTILLLGLAKAFSMNRFKQTYKSLFNYRVAQEVCSEEKVFFHRVNILLTINYLLIVALLIYQLKELLNPKLLIVSGFSLYLLIVVFLLTLNFVKFFLSKLLTFIFDSSSLITEYVYSVSLFNNLFGVILLPVMAMSYFTTLELGVILKFIALPMSFIMLIFRLLRVSVLARSKGVSYLYIFAYICSLEILPLVVMIKIFILT